MPPKSQFSRKTATTYALVHRPQDDPRIHDETAPSQVFTEISGPSVGRSKATAPSSKIKHRGDLEEEFGLSYRANEGEAAEHGVFFDDSQYDYMQHLRDLGAGGGDTAWIEPSAHKQSKGKGKQKLEDALRDVRLIDDDDADDLQSQGGISVASSRPSLAPAGPQRSVFEQQQDVPDALRGFQPDMDPRLREVLEALDDDAYVDEEEDVFATLTGDGAEEVDPYEWEEYGALDDEDDEGWASDDTTKPTREHPASTLANAHADDTGGIPLPDPHAAPPDAHDPLPSTTATRAPAAPAARSLAPSTASSIHGPAKKRKGALTSRTGGSMSSSVLARSEALSTLDSRFDRVLDQYMGDIPEGSEYDDGASMVSGMSRASQWTSGTDGPVPRLAENAALDGVMDEFLGGSAAKGRRMKKGGTQGTWGAQSGMAQLDEVRKGLGGARVKGRAAPGGDGRGKKGVQV